MKFVYVLTTDFNNYLAEQCYLSQFSLLKFNKDAQIITITDQDTYSKLNSIPVKLIKKTSNIVKFDCPSTMSMKERSRYLKLQMRNIVDGDFLYVDSDTIICDNLLSVFETSSSISQVEDLHIPYIENKFLQNNTIPKIKKANLTFSPVNYFNGGIIFSKDNKESRDFFNLALQTWLNYESNDFCIDQVAFNYANHKMDNFITPLDGIWNCQITENGIKYLANAKIIHYFATTNNSAFLLAHSDILNEIRINNGITEKIEDMIENAKSQFSDKAIVLSDTNRIAVYNSKLFALSLTLYKKARLLFNVINNFLKLLYK